MNAVVSEILNGSGDFAMDQHALNSKTKLLESQPNSIAQRDASIKKVTIHTQRAKCAPWTVWTVWTRWPFT